MVLGDDGFHIFGSSIPVTPGKGSVPEIPITEQQRESINTVSQPHQEGQTQYSNGNSDFFDLYIGNSSQPYQGGATPYSNGNPQLFDFNIGSSSQSYQGGPGQIHHYSNGNSSHSYQGLGQRHQYPNGNPRYWDFNIDPSYTRSILGNLSQQDGYSSGLTRNDMTSASSNSLATTHINGFPFMIPPNTNNTNYQQQQHTSQMTEFAAEQNTITPRSISGGGHRQGIQLCFGETGAKVPYVGFSLQHQRSVINFKNPTNTNYLGPITPEQFSLSQTRKNSQVERENYTDPKIKETIETSIHESNSNTLDLPADLGHQKNIPTTIEESQNREEDLNTTTPIQKPRRKKHRPKVIKESKTPRNPKRVDTPKGKRTPRKKKEEHSSERPSNEEEEETPIKRQRTVRTRAKRTLSFDNKELQLNDNESRSSTIARSNCNKDFLPEENSFKKSENSEVSNVDVKISQTLRRHNIRENMKALAREKGKEHNYHKNSDVLHKINENYNGITTHRDIDHIPNAAKKTRTNKSVSAGNGLNEICEVMIMQQNIIGTSFNQCPLDSKHPLFGYQTQEGFQSLMESLNSTALKVPRKRRSGKKNTNPYKTGGPVIPKVDLIDLITEKLQNMNINASSDGISHQELQKENAMVVYNRSSAMVPFFTPRKKPARAKVDLDSETNRVWMVLMGKNNGDCPEGADFDKKKWWEEERRVFQGRANSFIARMHLVQGDRRFSRWKGSVVDSVVGVFLTQNVSDHLSSSAFMSLVAKFPNCTRAEHAKPRSTEEYIVSFTEDEDISVKEGCDQNKTLEDQLNQNHHGIDPNKELTSIHEESIIIHEEESTIIQEEGSTIIQEEGSTTIHEEEKRINMLNYTECTLKSSGTTNFHETDDMRSIESTLSSQHSSESPVQALDQIGSGSALYVEEDIINGNSFDNMHMRTSFTELLQMAKDKVLQDYHPSKNENNTKEPGHDFEGVISSAPSDSSTPLQDVFYWHNHSHNLNKMGSEIRIDSVQSETEQFFQKKDDVTVSETHSNPINHPNNSEFTGSLGLKKEHKSSMPPKIVEISLNDPKVREEGNKAKAKTVKKPPENIDWDSLRRETYCDGVKEERNPDNIDSIDWEAIRRAPVGEIANIIRDRGMNNMLAERIKGFLDRLVRDHGSVDLEWLRDAPPDKVKDYLLSFRGLGLKSVECVRLLSLEHLAFPVDTNVGRICVRLGWVPLQPLPESLQLHLLEMYPMLETIQKYLWPRLCTLDQRTLYELHYQLITFGKVFCTKTKPNCNACPMRGECKHFASAFASARLALPGPEEKGLVASTDQILSNHGHKPFTSQAGPLQLEGTQEPPLQIEVAQVPPLQIDVTQRFPLQLEGTQILKEPNTCQPIIEEVLTPEPEPVDIPEWAIEDGFYEDPDEIPTIALNIEQLTQNVQNILHENEALLQNGDMSNALVALTPEAASIPQPKLKNVSRLRTEHLVYELPDGHPLLNNLDRREPDDPSPYLLAIWTPGETAQSTELPETICNSSSNGGVCDKSNCFSCSSIKEAQSQKVRGTLLIPCRTAMRGSFPLNGTYFQVNEVFADHASSIVPMDVPRRWIWSLTRRTVYFGTSVTSIFRGLTTEGIQQCFWRGFVCVRGFDQKTRAPRPLLARLHFSENRVVRNNKKNADNLKEQKKTS